jgi:hypothetical protein
MRPGGKRMVPPVVLEGSDAGATNTEAEVVLGEILALRKIVINLVYGRGAGQPLSEEHVRELIESADADKISKAAERLQAALAARLGGLKDGHHNEYLTDISGNVAATSGLADEYPCYTIAAFVLGLSTILPILTYRPAHGRQI